MTRLTPAQVGAVVSLSGAVVADGLVGLGLVVMIPSLSLGRALAAAACVVIGIRVACWPIVVALASRTTAAPAPSHAGTGSYGPPRPTPRAPAIDAGALTILPVSEWPGVSVRLLDRVLRHHRLHGPDPAHPADVVVLEVLQEIFDHELVRRNRAATASASARRTTE